MKRLVFALPAAIVTMAALLALPAQAQEAKKVRGKVTSISATSVSVDAAGVPMTFAVDGKTKVEAPGGSTATRRAEAQGKAGVAITELIKSGDAVEISYGEMGGKMQASTIRKVTSVGSATTTGSASSGATKSVSGKVSAVTATSITIAEAGAAAQTFTIDAKTQVIGKGAGTMSARRGGKVSATDLIGSGDSVNVTYTDMNGMMHAHEIRVTAKAGK